MLQERYVCLFAADVFLYMGLENSNGVMASGEALLPVVPRLPQHFDYCLKFSMVMEDYFAAKLRIMLHKLPGIQTTELRVITGDRDFTWRMVEVDFNWPLNFQVGMVLHTVVVNATHHTDFDVAPLSVHGLWVMCVCAPFSSWDF